MSQFCTVSPPLATVRVTVKKLSNFCIIWDKIQSGYLTIYEPSHEIMVLFILRKLILQTRMRSNSVGAICLILVGPFVYFHISCVRIAKALAILRRLAGAFAGRLYDKYQNLMSWLIYIYIYIFFFFFISVLSKDPFFNCYL